MPRKFCVHLLYFALAATCFDPTIGSTKAGEVHWKTLRERKAKKEKEQAAEKKRQQAVELQASRSCRTYPEELAEVKLSLKHVQDFRMEELLPRYTILLDDFGPFWNFVHNTWLVAQASDKKFIEDYREEYRRLTWKYREDDRPTFNDAHNDLRNQYKGALRNFAQKYFIAQSYKSSDWAFEIRQGTKGRVFPIGSVIELDEGELLITRHSQLQTGKKYGHFRMNLRIANDLYATRLKVVAQRGNFIYKKPEVGEVLASARSWAMVDEYDENYDENSDRLRLLLDPRWENCSQSTALPL